MNRDDEAFAIAARIADGSGIDWTASDATPSGAERRGVLNQLKAIASVAAIHRAPRGEDANDPLSTPSQWGPLTLIGKIAEGRFGDVYRAWEPRLQRQVALKLLHAASAATAASPTHAIEEARLLARVKHPNVLTVHGAECFDDRVGIWTEFIEGRTLEAIVAADGPLPAADAISIGIDLCHALAAVHDAGLLHRDVKAQNVMRETGGRIVLMDFGTGHDLERLPTREGDLSGTPLYLAPEIFAGGRPSVASDVYALAVLCFYLLTGRHPVPGQTLEDVRTGHRARRPVRLRSVGPDVPETLAAAIEQGLSADSAARHHDARAFAIALKHADAAPTDREPARAPLPMWRQPAMVLVGGIIIAVAALVWTIQRGGGTGRASPHTGISVGKMTTPRFDEMGRPSHDGRFLAYIDAKGDVWTWEIGTGAPPRRVTDASRSGGAGGTPLMSPNGDRLAYGWSLPEKGDELWVRNVDGSSPRVLISRETAFTPVPMDWSRDGREILCLLQQKNGSADLVLVSIDDGRQRLLYTNASMNSAGLSPDGRFVATHRDGAAPSTRELIIINAGGDRSEPRVLLSGPNTDRYPSWVDAEHVFFVRDEPHPPTTDAKSEGWILPVVDGVARGDPVKVTKDLGHPSTPTDVAVTDDGMLYQIVRGSLFKDVYIAPIDLNGVSAPGMPTRISATSVGDHVAPAWSPNGRFIAFFTTGQALPGFNPPRTLTLLDTTAGATTVLHPNLAIIGGYNPRWSADNASVVLWARRDSDPRMGYLRVDVRSGETTPVRIKGNLLPYFQCSPTIGSTDFFYADGSRGVVALNLTTGEDRVVIANDSGTTVWPFAVAPNGQSIAFVRTLGHTRTLEVMTLDGTPRELRRATGPLVLQAWTPDRQDLIYANGASAAGLSLWRISAKGGEPRDMHFALSPEVTSPISFNPDGSRIVYPERTTPVELWITRPRLTGK